MRSAIWCAPAAAGACCRRTSRRGKRSIGGSGALSGLLFRTIHDVALMLDRERTGREASPSAGILDSQSVKAPAARQRGYDAGKKILGRKRHVAVDSDGRLLMVNLTTADISDSAGAQMILDAIRQRWPWLKHFFADGAYDRGQL
jgi:putative transposase